MAISTLDGWIAARKSWTVLSRFATRASQAGFDFSVMGLAGAMTSGGFTLSVPNGEVPVAGAAGYPPMTYVGVSEIPYLSGVFYSANYVMRLGVYDDLFNCGTYTYNTSTTLTGQPSFSGRVFSADYTGLELWAEVVTAFTGAFTVSVGYTNQDGTTGRSTGAVTLATDPIVGRMIRIPLQAADSGIMQINSVTGTVASAGTFNLRVLKRLWIGHTPVAYYGDLDDPLKTGLPRLSADSALFVIASPASTLVGGFELSASIAAG